MEYLGKVVFKIHALAKGLFFGLMVTTAWMAYRICESALGGSTTISPELEAIIIVGAALIITYLIDNALYEHAVASIAQMIKQGGLRGFLKSGGIATGFLFGLMLFRFLFSGGATYLTGESTVLERQKDSGNIELVENLNNQQSEAIARIKAAKRKEANQILHNAKSEATEIKYTAERLAKKKVETAIAQGSFTEQEAYKKGDWIRRAYSVAIKKAKSEAYKMEEDAAKKAQALVAAARSQHKSTLAQMQEEVYKERNSSKWTALQTEVERNITAQNWLWTAERWTYYFIDLILVFGGFGCAWLVAFYLVHFKEPMDVFFPDKPGITDVIGDAFDSIYAYIVTVMAQIPAYFKREGSKKMVRVAKSVASSSAEYSGAIGRYHAARDHSIAAEFGAAERHNAIQEGREKARKKRKPPTLIEKDSYKAKPQRATQRNAQRNATVAQQGATDLTDGWVYISNDNGATETQQSATEPKETAQQPQQEAQQRNGGATNISKSGGSFRSYMSRAGELAAKGDYEATLQQLDKAIQAIPDDHLQANRMARVNQFKNKINDK